MTPVAGNRFLRVGAGGDVLKNPGVRYLTSHPNPRPLFLCISYLLLVSLKSNIARVPSLKVGFGWKGWPIGS